jgi:predicted phage terminase large subunit-like protein
MADDIEVVDAPQHGPHVVRVRAWDLAASKPTSKYPDPDWTVGVLMSLDTQMGSFCIEDVTYLRDAPGKVKATIMSTAARDGLDTWVRWPQDPAQAGKSQSWDFAVALSKWDARGIPAQKNKVTMFSPFAAAASAEGGSRVSMVRAPWNADYIGSQASFPTKGVHDDDVDATSLAYATLVRLDETLGNESRSVDPSESADDEWERQMRRARGLPAEDY